MLKTRELLPPKLVFTISITDSSGNIIVSSGSSELSNVADQDYFQNQIQGDTFSISRPQPGRDSGALLLHFSRSLVNAVDGGFSGIVMVSVDPDYFVSSYDSSVPGEPDFHGLVGTDRVFRIRRSGETVSASVQIDYTAMIIHTQDEAPTCSCSSHSRI